MLLPNKKKRGKAKAGGKAKAKELTPEQKAENRHQASQRVSVEGVAARVCGGRRSACLWSMACAGARRGAFCVTSFGWDAACSRRWRPVPAGGGGDRGACAFSPPVSRSLTQKRPQGLPMRLMTRTLSYSTEHLLLS